MSQQDDYRAGRRQAREGFPLYWIFAVAAVLFVAGLVAWVVTSNGDASAVKIGPRLRVAQDKLDLGRQPFDKMVRADFSISNTGDRPLTLDASAPVQALQGC